MLVPPESRQQCLLWCAASLCLSATVLLLDWTTVAETARFEGGTEISCICTEKSLNLGGQASHRWNLRWMSNIMHAGYPGLSWIVSAQFTLKMCIAAQIDWWKRVVIWPSDHRRHTRPCPATISLQASPTRRSRADEARPVRPQNWHQNNTKLCEHNFLC